ncbi:MAG: flagellar hook-length control protein FliK [Sulfuricella sp.]|nr:flagellar hook-length control protein FliK [Sulfuricella sp.]
MPQLPITPAVSPQPSAGISQTSAPAASAAEGGDGLEHAPGLNFGAVLTKQLKGIASLLEQKEGAGLSLAAVNESAESAANAGAAVLPVDLSVLTASMLVPAPPIQARAGAGIPAEAGAEKPLIQLPTAGEVRSAESAANAGAAVLPVDLSVLTASMLVPASPALTGMLVPASPARTGVVAGIPAEAEAGKPLTQLPKAGEVRLAAEIAASGKNLPQAVSPEQRFADKLAALVEVPAGNAGGGLHSTDLSVVANPSATAVAFRNPEPLLALPVAPRVGSAEWGGAVGEKIVWMANKSHQVAELHLNPPNLGPLEVRLTISNDQASALFVSHHSAVREAIETALPRLREMLADNGIMLGNVTVGSESFSQQQASDQRNGKEGSRGGLGAEGVMARIEVPGRPAGLARDGMVDIFA